MFPFAIFMRPHRPTYNRSLHDIYITIKVVECRSKGQIKVYATAFHQYETCKVKLICGYRGEMFSVMSIHVLSIFLTNINKLSKLASAEFIRLIFYVSSRVHRILTNFRWQFSYSRNHHATYPVHVFRPATLKLPLVMLKTRHIVCAQEAKMTDFLTN